MKIINNKFKKSFLKKIFIKICRIFGYEIIDQSNFSLETQGKSLNENLSIQGKKSITLPLGEVNISRQVKALTIILRSCCDINMLSQNKKRLFDKKKSEYTFRSLNSIIESTKLAKKSFPNIKFDLIVIDYKSKANDVDKIKNQLKKSEIDNSFISLNINDFKKNIKETNAEKKTVTENQISNMSNIHKSLLVAKNQCKDLVYFVEDDYIHQKEAIHEMIFAYERLSSQLKEELILCPADYPYLYSNMNSTNVFLGSSRHWRVVKETLCTFLTSAEIIEKHWSKFISMCQFEHYPFEKPLHEIYKSQYCLSPMPAVALHFTNINSIYGLSPIVDWKKVWDENENY